MKISPFFGAESRESPRRMLGGAMRMYSISAVLLLLSSTASAAPPAGPVAPGRYLLAATPEEISGRARALDATVQTLFLLARPFARSTLEKKTRIAEWIEIRRTGDEITITFKGRGPIRGALGMVSIWTSPEGEAVAVEVREEGDALVLTLKSGDGSRTNRFRPSANGALNLSVEVSSKRFPGVLGYALSYRREEASHADR